MDSSKPTATQVEATSTTSAGSSGRDDNRPVQADAGNRSGAAGKAATTPLLAGAGDNGGGAAVGGARDNGGGAAVGGVGNNGGGAAVGGAGDNGGHAGDTTAPVNAAGSGPDAGAVDSSCASQPETCNGADDDCDGLVDEQLTMVCGMSDTPPCKKGKRECINGAYGECVGAVDPTKDVCDAEMRDDDCDGHPNAGCACTEGAVSDCSPKPGVCKPGKQTCVGGQWDGMCKGEQAGTPEVCDGVDNDCDLLHLVDDGDLCKAGFVCKGSQGCVSNAPDGDVRAAIQTANGNYLTVIDGGGHAAPAGTVVAIHTNAKTAGAWETFQVEWKDAEYKRFALKTASGRYLTAVAGGGVGRSADGTAYVTTDSRSISEWERLILHFNRAAGSVTIRTQSGYYLTTVQGGNIADAGPLHTDATTAGPFEIFTTVSY